MTATVTIELTEAEGDFILSALASYANPKDQDAMAMAVDGKVDAAVCEAFQPTDVRD